MNISYRWLKSLLEIDLTPEELAAAFIRLGHEVDEIVYLGQGLEQVVVGRAVAVRPHPDADKLRLVTVDYGAAETLEVVCGAPNVEAGGCYPLARVGAALPGGLELKKAKIRGVESQGMLCSERELGLSEEAAGLLELDRALTPGAPLTGVLGLDDWRIVLDLSANRGDMWSHIGAARDLQPVVGKKLIRPESTCAPSGGPIDKLTSVEIRDERGCPRYMARVIEGVKVGPSPAWLVQRLAAVGQRSISNVVDITNFILFELGQPLHSFDLDRLTGGRIVVRRAAPGEKITTLDGVERTLDEDMTVIADAVKPVAVAGVMGDKLTEVGDGTTRILLECAYFNPGVNRRTSRRLGLPSEATRRFERGVDYEWMPYALDRAGRLIAEVSGGRVVEGVIDIYPHPIPPKEVSLRAARAAKLLGLEFGEADIRRCLEWIDCKVESEGEGRYRVTVPACRHDVAREIDLIEELARVNGYDKIPVPERLDITPSVSGRAAYYDLAEVRTSLAGLGLNEVITSTFIGSEFVASIYGPGAFEPPELVAPLSSEDNVLRPELLPSLLNCVRRNLNHRHPDIRIFETGKVFARRPGESGTGEERRLGLAQLGSRKPVHWSGKPVQLDFYDMKGVLETLAARLNLPGLVFAPGSHAALHPGMTAEVILAGETVGVLGQISPRLAGQLELPESLCLAELNLDRLLAALIPRRYTETSQFPGSRRDLSILVDEGLPSTDLVAEIERSSRLVAEVTIFDLYQGEHVPSGKKSLAFSALFQSAERTLRDEEVDQAFDRILRSLIKKFDVKLR